jgi:ATP-dependent DNA ligase
MKTITLYHRKVKGKVKVWKCWVRGRWVYSEWGQQDGEMQTTKEIATAKGSGTHEEAALRRFDRKVELRRRRGYVDTVAAVVEEVVVHDDTIDFDRLPRSFAPAKPVKKIDLRMAEKWDQQDLLFIQRKRDGMRHRLVADTKGELRIYSSSNDDVTEHLQPLLRGLKLPPRTILDVELAVTEPGPDECDGFLIVSGIARSLPDRARKQIALAEKMGAQVRLWAFDLLYLDGVPVYRSPYEQRHMVLTGLLLKQKTQSVLVMPNLVEKSLGRAIEMVKKKKWEGLVIWRKDQATVVQVNGSPKRVNCYKVKFEKEEDVIATGFQLGKGKNADVVGKFEIALWDGDRGPRVHGRVLTPMGRCGTGLDDATREEALKWTYPCVIQIRYDVRTKKGFRFPVFVRRRIDKKVAECVF